MQTYTQTFCTQLVTNAVGEFDTFRAMLAALRASHSPVLRRSLRNVPSCFFVLRRNKALEDVWSGR